MELARILDALARPRPAGSRIRDWSLQATSLCRVTLGVKDGETGNAHAPLTTSEALGARYLIVWEDGTLSRGFLERRQMELDVEQALEHARAAAYDDPDAAVVLGPSEIPVVRMHDDTVAGLARGESGLLETRLRSVRELVDRLALRTWSGSFSAAEGQVRLITSAGFDAGYRATSFGWHVTLNGEIGDGFGARCTDDEPSYTARLERLVELARRLDEPAPAMNGAVRPVLLHPRVVESYVLGTLLHNLDGATVAHDEGHFRRAQFDAETPVLREDLGVRVDPLIPLRSGSYPFTSAGLPAAPCAFIRAGRLIQPVLDLKYARRLGRPPTALPQSLDTVFLEGPAAVELRDALLSDEDGALVPSVLGVHTQDGASGDFSLSAPQALRLGPQGIVGRLRATLSGNLFEILSSADLRLVRFPGEHTPGLLFPCRLDPK